MTTQTSTEYEKYYVPEKSKLAICATIGLILSIYGAASIMNDMTFGDPDETPAPGRFSWSVCFSLRHPVRWFRIAIRENIAGMNSAQLKKSYVLGMFWFIFSEVMFFFAFFGALFYVRNLVGPWLGGEGDGGRMNGLLWEGFEFAWPMMQTPRKPWAARGPAYCQQRLLHQRSYQHGLCGRACLVAVAAYVEHHYPAVFQFHLPHRPHGYPRWQQEEVQLLAGPYRVAGYVFLYLQYAEYHEAYVDFGLTLNSGIYGSTFFMLTGFHGFHVCMGMTMLLIQWLRSVRGGHFTADDHFGFEASSWYWHFVDVVWVFLFLFVYIL